MSPLSVHVCVTNSSMYNERMNYSRPLTNQHLDRAHAPARMSVGVEVCVCVRVFYFGMCVRNSV